MRNWLSTLLGIALVWISLFIPFDAYAFDVPPNDGLVTIALKSDVTVLSQEQRDALAMQLEAYDRQTSNQIAIVIVQSLEGTPIEQAGLEIARKWGVGSSKDNGILLLFSYDDREVRIDVGYGLEGAVPDLVAKGIIDTDLIPHFRSGDYFGGFQEAIDSLKKHIGGEFTAERYASNDTAPLSPYIFFFLFIGLQWLVAILGRTKSWWLGGVLGGLGGLLLSLLFGWWLTIPALIPLGLLLDYIVSRNYRQRGPTSWWAGGGWGPGGGGGRFGGGRGGFGGFGGGGFGGGGASGRW